MVSPSICIIDDEPDLVEACSDILSREGYRTEKCPDGEHGLGLLKEKNFDLALVDLMMPRVNGFKILQEVRKENPACKIIIFTGHPTIESAVMAMKEGAFDYLVKPFMAGQLISTVGKAMAMKRLEEENKALRIRMSGVAFSHGLVGESAVIKDVLNLVQKVAPLDSNILITGESGTGKELVAKAAHFNGNRRENNFVPINCSALPEPLLESELFGYEKGAFSGAAHRSIGLFEFADKGTLFLDEIGDLPMSLQAKLLRALQEKEIRRVGAKEQLAIDVRIIASTNQDLEDRMAKRLFREDLFFRLNVIRIKLPPLRERQGDVPLLARHFLDIFNKTHGKNLSVSPEAMDLMEKYPWPGNVRELENAVFQGASIAESEAILPSNLPESVSKKRTIFGPLFIDKTFKAAKSEVVRSFEKDYAYSRLESTRGNVSAAALQAGLHRSAFQRLIRKYHIHPTAVKAMKRG